MPIAADSSAAAPAMSSLSALLARRGRYAGLADLVHLIQSQRPAAVPIGHVGPANREAVRLVPHLSLAFPTSDVASVNARNKNAGDAPTDDDGWRIEVACMGLYGPSSPLPSYLTESLFDHGYESSARVKDFLDIFNHRLLSLLVRALAKHRPFGPTAAAVLERVTGQPDSELNPDVTGTGASAAPSNAQPHSQSTMIASVLGRRPLSAAALEAALAAWLPGVTVRIVPCVATWTDVPADSQARLNTPIGGGLGVRMRTCITAFRIALGPLNASQFNDLLPGSPGHQRVMAVAREANPSGLEVLVRLTTAPGALPPSALNGTARLGRTTRLDGVDRGHVIDLTPSAKAHYA